MRCLKTINNMSLLRLCAYSAGLARGFAVDRSVWRFLNGDHCRLCLRLRSNVERQIQGNDKQFYFHAVICLVLLITLSLSFLLFLLFTLLSFVLYQVYYVYKVKRWLVYIDDWSFIIMSQCQGGFDSSNNSTFFDVRLI